MLAVFLSPIYLLFQAYILLWLLEILRCFVTVSNDIADVEPHL